MAEGDDGKQSYDWTHQRRRETKAICARVVVEVLERIDAYVSRQGIDRSAAINRFLADGIAEAEAAESREVPEPKKRR